MFTIIILSLLFLADATSFGFAFQLKLPTLGRPTKISFSRESKITSLYDTLTQWLLDSGCNPTQLNSVRIDAVKGLRGLYANRDIGAREVIFKIPYELVLETGDTLKDGVDGRYLIGGDLDYVNCDGWDKDTIYDVYQGLMLLNNIQSSDYLIYDTYLSNLPKPPTSYNDAGLTPDFWPDQLINELEVPPFINEVMTRKHIVNIVAEKNSVDENELRWATWMIRSRRFTTLDMVDDSFTNDNESFFNKIIPKKVEQIKGFLLPLIDMANHAHEPNAAMKIEVNKWTRKFDDTSSFALLALKPISKNEEITISYGDGDWTCLQMMDKYGFFLKGNTVDESFDWKQLDCTFSTSLEEDKKEVLVLKSDDENHGSRLDMLSLRIYLKQMLMQ